MVGVPSGILTSKLIIRESESPLPAALSILISQMTISSVIIPYIIYTKGYSEQEGEEQRPDEPTGDGHPLFTGQLSTKHLHASEYQHREGTGQQEGHATGGG